MTNLIEKFFGELLNDKEAKECLAEKKPQTLEDLAKITGGLAGKYGYKLTEDEILSHLNERLSKTREKSDAAAESLAAIKDSDMEAVAAGQDRPHGGPGGPYPMPECGMPQLAEILKKMKEYGENH